MRLLFATSAVPTHHFTMLPFAWAALAAGHEVCVATGPELAATAARSGLPVVPVGPPGGFDRRNQELLDRARGSGGAVRYDPKQAYCEVAAAMLDDLVALTRRWRPDVVVWDPACFAAPVAAAVTGALAVRYLWGVDIVGRGTTLTERLPESFGELYARYGLERPADPDWWTLDPTPPATWPVRGRRRSAVRYVPHSPYGRVPEWLYAAPERPRVVVTFGTTTSSEHFAGGSEFTRSPLMRAALDLDAELLLVVRPGEEQQFTGLPGQVRPVAGAPLSAVLRGASAVVHHGGNGTLLHASFAGVPQLVLPGSPEQRFSAEQFGCYPSVRRDDAATATAESLGAHFAELLTPGAREAAAGLRRDMLGAPSPAALLPTLRLAAAARR
ncbi:nucleotide disphospho-sugar-binding domain-containing protein [Kitasatospora sp. NPDC056446]|uniref:nucleotide disphospho-sugar-binding domain-containing protein n=1 Tax=Kitasatospora sp. NPDC056446 TaxID=3345819 RepID=UPI0036BAA587